MDLVGVLASKLELEYISLLPVVRVPPELIYHIYELPEEGVCIEDYVRLAQYIRCGETDFESIAQAKRLIAAAMGARDGITAGR